MHRLIVWFIAVVFVFNGAASLASIDLAELAAVAAHDSGVPAGGYEVQSHQQTGDVVTAEPYHRDGSSHDDNCQKCCGMCSQPSLMPASVVTAVTFADEGVTFQAGHHHLVGQLVAVDPGIPKILV